MDSGEVTIAITTGLRFTALALLTLVRQLHVKDLPVTSLHISLISTVSWLGILLFSPIWGALSDVLGQRKQLLIFSLLGTAVTYFLFIPFHSYWTIILLSLLSSTLGAGFPPITLALVSDKIEKGERGQRLSVFNSSRSFGFFTGRICYWILILSLMTLAHQFWVVFLIMGGGAFFSFFFPESEVQQREDSEFGSFLEKVKERLTPSLEGLNLTESGGIFLLIAVALRKGAIVGVFSLLYVYMANVGIPSALIGLLVALNPATQVIFMIIFGKLTDQIGRKKIFLLGFGLCAFVPFLFSFGRTVTPFILGFILLGIGFSGVQTGSVAFIKDIAPDEKSAELLGLRRTSQGLSAVLLSLFAGEIASIRLFGYTGMLTIMGGLMIFAFVIALFLTKETL